MIDRHLIALAVALQHMDDDVPRLQAWGRDTAAAMAAGGRLFACGTGASAQQARHLVAELAAPEDDRPPLPADTLEAEVGAPLRACGPLHHEAADAREAMVGRVREDCHPGDVLLCLSATANDEQVAAVAAAADQAGMRTWALTGQCPNTVAAACGETVCVDAVARTTIEEVHVAAIHIFCAALNSAVRDAIHVVRWSPAHPDRTPHDAPEG